jgi:hypothetical protein
MKNNLTFTGRITEIKEPRTGESAKGVWASIDFEVTEDSAEYPQSALFSMFGFNRQYCSMTGVPIIGKYFKIGGKIVSKEAYEAHKILQEIEDRYDKSNMPSAEELTKQYTDNEGDN